MHTIEYIQNLIEESISNQKFDGYPPRLYEPIHYTMSQGGKRLRPSLMLLACEVFAGDIHKALYPSIGMEVFHNFTLVHDDIMDQAPLRRNRETVYKKWDTNLAILSGDTMFAMAYDFLLKTDAELLPLILPVFNRTAIEVCEGQQLDMEFENQKDTGISDYMEMIRLKTGVLLAASLKTGALIGGASAAEADGLYNYGIKIGLAFQLMDDLLDVFADESRFGKVSGNDIITNKKTFLYLTAYKMANDEQKKALDTHFSPINSQDSNQKIEAVKSLYLQIGVREQTISAMDALYQEAKEILAALNLSNESKSELIRFSEILMVRKY
ncbi:MAG: polyprenyl synthetase family protein [Bacteroidales bacterium]|nr:polyprenyl synthetase family protein [Bacteroidales bacterium]